MEPAAGRPPHHCPAGTSIRARSGVHYFPWKVTPLAGVMADPSKRTSVFVLGYRPRFAPSASQRPPGQRFRAYRLLTQEVRADVI